MLSNEYAMIVQPILMGSFSGALQVGDMLVPSRSATRWYDELDQQLRQTISPDILLKDCIYIYLGEIAPRFQTNWQSIHVVYDPHGGNMMYSLSRFNAPGFILDIDNHHIMGFNRDIMIRLFDIVSDG